MKSAPQSEMLAIESEPPGAEARTSLGQSCRTPCQLAVQPSSEFSEAGCGSSPSGSIAAGGLGKPNSSAGATLGGGGAIRHQLSLAVAIIERRAE